MKRDVMRAVLMVVFMPVEVHVVEDVKMDADMHVTIPVWVNVKGVVDLSVVEVAMTVVKIVAKTHVTIDVAIHVKIVVVIHVIEAVAV